MPVKVKGGRGREEGKCFQTEANMIPLFEMREREGAPVRRASDYTAFLKNLVKASGGSPKQRCS